MSPLSPSGGGLRRGKVKSEAQRRQERQTEASAPTGVTLRGLGGPDLGSLFPERSQGLSRDSRPHFADAWPPVLLQVTRHSFPTDVTLSSWDTKATQCRGWDIQALQSDQSEFRSCDAVWVTRRVWTSYPVTRGRITTLPRGVTRRLETTRRTA